MALHTANYMGIAVGQTVKVRCEGWTIPMVVQDVKSAWGKIRLHVRPIDGDGAQWIEMDRVSSVKSSSSDVLDRHASQLLTN